MGFIDYAWATSLQRDDTKVKILQDPALTQPALENDGFGYTIKLPYVQKLEDGGFMFLGYTFDGSNAGKSKMGRLFRASVLHLTAHTLEPLAKERVASNSQDSIVEAFTRSIINDFYVNTYITTKNPDRLYDIAYANAAAYQKTKATRQNLHHLNKSHDRHTNPTQHGLNERLP